MKMRFIFIFQRIPFLASGAVCKCRRGQLQVFEGMQSELKRPVALGIFYEMCLALIMSVSGAIISITSPPSTPTE